MSVPGQRALSRRRRTGGGEQSEAGRSDGPETPGPVTEPAATAASLSDDDLASRLLRVLLFLPAESWMDGSSAPATAGRLIRLLVWEGRDTEVAAFLAPTPGGDGSFEVQPEEPSGETRSFGPDLAAAVREAMRIAKGGTAVRIYSVAGGLRRCVLRSGRDDRPALDYVPPTPSAFEGEPELRSGAAREWAALAFPPAVPLRPQPEAPPGPDVAAEVRRALGGLTVEVDRSAIGSAVTDSLAGLQTGMGAAQVQEAVRAALEEMATTVQAQVEAAVRSALDGATIGVDRAEIEAAVRQAMSGSGVGTDQAIEIRELTGLIRRLLETPGRAAG